METKNAWDAVAELGRALKSENAVIAEIAAGAPAVEDWHRDRIVGPLVAAGLPLWTCGKVVLHHRGAA